MTELRDLLSSLPLPAPDGEPTEDDVRVDRDLVPVLGGGLPGAHLHVWGGPAGAGKTSFLLEMLHGAAAAGRRVLYATYDLPAATLATRLLAMTCETSCERILRGDLEPERAARVARARAALSRLPFAFLEARGLGVASLEDRIVRRPHRTEVLAVDFLQAVVRPPGTDLGHALRDLSELASRLHLAIVCALRSEQVAARDVEAMQGAREEADRVGWIASAPGSAPSARKAEVLDDRYGEARARSMPLTIDAVTGMLRRRS